jgi:hypothetical protein
MVKRYILLAFTLLSSFCLSPRSLALNSISPPYPQSQVISGITWDFDNLLRLAPGSDLWPVTWASDNNLYTSWGDGGGFGGTNSDGRVSLGFGCIEGSPNNLVGYNIWGGKNAVNPATFSGKSMSLLAVDGSLYAWINLQNKSNPDFTLARSTDYAAHWQLNSWVFSNGIFGEPTFLNFGKDYHGARDNYVYIYGVNRDPSLFWTQVWLARVPKNQILTRGAYEFFTGFDGSSAPTWSIDITDRKPVFEDPNGVGITSVSYNPGINRYILTSGHGPHSDGLRRLGLFDAPEPWGPWTTIEYYENWGNFPGYWLGYYIPTKSPGWLSSDGRIFHLIFSGDGDLDSFNLIKGTFSLVGDQTSAPEIQQKKNQYHNITDFYFMSNPLDKIRIYLPLIQKDIRCIK